MKSTHILTGPLITFLIAVAFGCRDTGVESGTISIEGYRIEGTAFDGLGQPFVNLPVALFYDMEYLNSNAPTREYTIQTPGEFVNIDVYDGDSVLVRNLYAGSPAGTTIFVPWDRLRNDSTLVGSGVYTVRVTVGAELRHSYLDVVDGNITAVTDADGAFIIHDVSLPVGYSPAPVYNSTGAFIGNYRITDRVYLECNVGGVEYVFPVRLVEGILTRIALRIQ